MIIIQPDNKQVSKKVVRRYSCHAKINNFRILILIGSFGCLKDAKTMDMSLGKCTFPHSFPYIQ